jgi:hypothetical protein
LVDLIGIEPMTSSMPFPRVILAGQVSDHAEMGERPEAEGF